jgi:hypothetical protein
VYLIVAKWHSVKWESVNIPEVLDRIVSFSFVCDHLKNDSHVCMILYYRTKKCRHHYMQKDWDQLQLCNSSTPYVFKRSITIVYYVFKQVEINVPLINCFLSDYSSSILHYCTVYVTCFSLFRAINLGPPKSHATQNYTSLQSLW